ncbi:MAG: hypothetical protein EZS28_045860 [Streblomastix strix]|uniref:Uncharacterized protein n=1 Tax=Streblomastix strix TaxID=222440 RepID=A0A5J4TLI6_9EUKA|nr:MAG: hypothetical protein EZS28_045860 [Streblomastix strix]
MAVGIFSKIKQLVQKVGKGLQWANDNVYKPFIKPFAKPILGALGPVGQIIGKGLDVASSFLDYGYAAGKPKLLPSAGSKESGIRPASYILPFKPFDSKYRLNTHTLQVPSSTIQN